LHLTQDHDRPLDVWLIDEGEKLFLLCGLPGCGGPLVGVTVVDERTALENQVLGTYEELNQEVLLVASVRYIDPKGKLKPTPKIPPGKKKGDPGYSAGFIQ